MGPNFVRLHYLVGELDQISILGLNGATKADIENCEAAETKKGHPMDDLSSVAPFERGGSNSLIFGAQVRQVEEPHCNIQSTSEITLFRSQAIIQVEFDEIAEPKGLAPTELLQLVKKFGSSYKAAEVIGVSEAFVRQNIFQKRSKRRSDGKTR